MKRIILLSALTHILFSCGYNREEQMLYDYEQENVSSINFDLNNLDFEIHEIEKIGEITAKDSIQIIKENHAKILYGTHTTKEMVDTLTFDYIRNERLNTLISINEDLISRYKTMINSDEKRINKYRKEISECERQISINTYPHIINDYKRQINYYRDIISFPESSINSNKNQITTYENEIIRYENMINEDPPTINLESLDVRLKEIINDELKYIRLSKEPNKPLSIIYKGRYSLINPMIGNIKQTFTKVFYTNTLQDTFIKEADFKEYVKI